MRLALLVALLSCGSLPSHAGGCKSEDEANAAVATATKRNEAAYSAALGRKKLATVALAQWGSQRRDESGPDPAPPDKVVERDYQGKKVQIVAEGERTVNCEYTPPDFAIDAATSKVYRIERKARTTKTTRIGVCTCAPAHFACGGANLGREDVGFVLPDGATFGGVLTVDVDTEVVETKYAVGRSSPCPEIAPPPTHP